MRALMKLRIAAGAILTLGLAVLAGCGGDSDALTLDAYFAEFEMIDADVDAQVEALFADFPEGESEEQVFADDANLPFFKELTAGFPLIITDAVEQLNALDPPSVVEDEHDELVEAGDSLIAAFEEASAALGETATMAEFAEVEQELDSSLVQPATQRFDLACLDVVAAGEENGITSTVDCVDEEA